MIYLSLPPLAIYLSIPLLPFTHPSINLSISPSLPPSIHHLSLLLQSIHPLSIHPSISNHLSIPPSPHPHSHHLSLPPSAICPSLPPSIHSFIHHLPIFPSFPHLSIIYPSSFNPSICYLPFHLSIHLSLLLSIHVAIIYLSLPPTLHQPPTHPSLPSSI